MLDSYVYMQQLANLNQNWPKNFTEERNSNNGSYFLTFHWINDLEMVENTFVIFKQFLSLGTKPSWVEGIKVSSHTSTRYGNYELVNMH